MAGAPLGPLLMSLPRLAMLVTVTVPEICHMLDLYKVITVSLYLADRRLTPGWEC